LFKKVFFVFKAGPSGDKRGSEEVQMWMHSYLAPKIGKPIKFYQAAKGINFQVRISEFSRNGVSGISTLYDVCAPVFLAKCDFLSRTTVYLSERTITIKRLR